MLYVTSTTHSLANKAQKKLIKSVVKTPKILSSQVVTLHERSFKADVTVFRGRILSVFRIESLEWAWGEKL